MDNIIKESVFDFSSLETTIEKYGLKKKDVIIVGSSSITLAGGRKNSDIDICIPKKEYKKMPFRICIAQKLFDHYEASDYIDFYFDRYIILGITDNMLFENKWYTENMGWKVVNLEIEIAYKIKIARAKDLEDYFVIKNNQELKEKISWDWVEILCNKYVSKYLTTLYNFKDLNSLLIQKIKK